MQHYCERQGMANITGTEGAETLAGTGSDDVITGLGGDDALGGLAGNDLLLGGAGNDVLGGGQGNDTLDGGPGLDTANYGAADAAVNVNLATGLASSSTEGSDQLLSIEQVNGSRFRDLLVGGNPANGLGDYDGFEALRGNAGNDTLSGGPGFDVALYDTSPAAVIVRLGGANNATGAAQDGYGDTDTLVGIEEVRGSRYNDVLVGSNSGPLESFEGLAGNDSINGRGGLDVANYSQSPAGVAVNLAAGTASDGWGGTDLLLNIEGVRGSDFADTLTGGAQANFLEGGVGNDTLDGGAGQDAAMYTHASGSVSVNLASGVVSGADGVDKLAGIESVYGSAFNDALTGDAGDNFLCGNAGNDTLDGGAGVDTADYYFALTPVTADLAARTASGGDGSDVLSAIENLRGSCLAGDTLKGDADANRLDGDGGNDSLLGAGGDDVLVGGDGNDTLDGGTGNDTAVLRGKLADYSISYDAFSGRFTLTDGKAGRDGTDSISGAEQFQFADTQRSASQLAAYISDKAAPLLVSATPGNGKVGVGLNANITLTFSEPVTLAGTLLQRDWTGAVVEKFDPGSPRVSFNGNTLTLDPTDPLALRTGYLLQMPTGSIVDAAGNGFAGGAGYHFFTLGSGQLLHGTAGNNRLTGGTGDDTLDSDDSDAVLDGAAGNDIVSGGAGRDNLVGGTGDDVLIGGAGADTMSGGSGSDTYYISDASDVIFEPAVDDAAAGSTSGTSGASDADRTQGTGNPDLGRSVDKVVASINYTLTSFVENLALANAAGNLAGTGNDLNNVLTGNEGNNTLQGGFGNDTLDGDDGLDTAVYSGARALYSLSIQAAGTTVADSRSGTGSDGVDNLARVERLQFADARLALDTGATQVGGEAALLVGAVLGKAAVQTQPAIVGAVIGLLDSGLALPDLCAAVMAMPIWGPLANGGAATASNTQIASYLLTLLNGNAPDDATLAAAVAALDNDPAGDYLCTLALSDACQAAVNLAGLASTGVAYV